MESTRKEHLRRLIRDKFDGDQSRFAARIGRSKGRITQLLDPDKAFGERAAKYLAAKLGLPERYFDRLITSDAPATSSTGYGRPFPQTRETPAHLVIQPADTVTPSHNWGEIVPNSLPEVFSVALVDDSMAPDLPAGSVITFAAGSAAISGNGVLLTDKDGTLYFRQYRARTATAWQAVAKNPDYLPLDSVVDGLTVVAVVTNISKAGSMI